MNKPITQQAYTVASGTSFIGAPIQEARNPTSTDTAYTLYQTWQNTATGIMWQLVSFTSTTGTVLANWVQFATSATDILTLTGNSGGAVGPSAGNVNVVGDGTTITITGNPATNTLTASLIGGHAAIEEFIPDTGTSPVVPTAGGIVTMSGSGSIQTVGGTNQLTTQLTGLTNHNVLVGAGTSTITKVPPSTSGFVLTSNGAAADPSFQSVSAAGAITTITGNSGGAEVPTAGGNFNILGTGSITVAGSPNTETVQLTGLTNHAVLVGAGTATITNVGPSATTGAPLISAGSSADPAFSTTFKVLDASQQAIESAALVGGVVQLSVQNTDNTNSASGARVTITTGGANAGDAYALYDLDVAGNNYEMGARNSDSHFVLNRAANTATANLSGTNLLDVNPTGSTGSQPTFTFTGGQIRLTDANASDVTEINVRNTSSSDFSVVSAEAHSPKTGFFTSGQYDTPLFWNFGMASTLSNAFAINTSNAHQAPEGGTIRWRMSQTGAVTFNEAFTFPTADGSSGQVLTTNGSGSVSWGSGATAPVTYTNVNHAASPYTVLSTDYYLSVDTSGGTVTLNFPNAPTAKQTWVIKDRTGTSATNNITITTPGGTVTFDGSTSKTINTNYASIQLLANSTPTYEIF